MAFYIIPPSLAQNENCFAPRYFPHPPHFRTQIFKGFVCRAPHFSNLERFGPYSGSKRSFPLRSLQTCLTPCPQFHFSFFQLYLSLSRSFAKTIPKATCPQPEKWVTSAASSVLALFLYTPLELFLQAGSLTEPFINKFRLSDLFHFRSSGSGYLPPASPIWRLK